MPWVTSVRTDPETIAVHSTTTLEVSVNDMEAAETQLLVRVLGDGRTRVTAFGRKQHTLEDVFLDLVEGGKSNAHP
jgi:hypothetical protein